MRQEHSSAAVSLQTQGIQSISVGQGTREHTHTHTPFMNLTAYTLNHRERMCVCAFCNGKHNIQLAQTRLFKMPPPL